MTTDQTQPRKSLTSSPERTSSRTLCPNDHLKTLIELLKPSGADLARRWVAALMLVPEDEREAVVRSIEAKLVELYDSRDESAEDETLLHIAEEPTERDGCVVQVIRSYAPAPETPSGGTAEKGLAGQG